MCLETFNVSCVHELGYRKRGNELACLCAQISYFVRTNNKLFLHFTFSSPVCPHMGSVYIIYLLFYFVLNVNTPA